MYVPGCPPRPEALLHGILMLQQKIADEEPDRRVDRPAPHGGLADPRPRRAGRRGTGAAGMSTAIGTPERVGARLAEAVGLAEPLPAHDASGTPCVDVPPERWHDVLVACRDGGGLDLLDWLSAVDEPAADPASLDVVAHLVDSRSGGPRHEGGLVRLLVRTRLPTAGPSLASVTDLWPGAAWHERETHEMFGVDFTGFDDGTDEGLRPLLLPDGFEGTPLRKSFQARVPGQQGVAGREGAGESDAGTSPSRRKPAAAGRAAARVGTARCLTPRRCSTPCCTPWWCWWPSSCCPSWSGRPSTR
ncbi:hypothetical protein GCM10025868_31320 [Angustibacter aerolatus]|uniref:NADH:ubiquinone oxidoreductase 30kDa subunit domain-containing protein n=1 Tax=Angustibacter aerolatus TaxID=1162965 RepID=A0ABQ6JI29_9ACTN|nr:hypothetical protein GCM10025868_31320 [Angustibacter aerolatus]